MDRQFYMGLANTGTAVPIAAHLVLHERDHPEQVLLDGRCLGEVVIETARRIETPLAIPLMDLEVEKRVLLECLGVPPEEMDRFHFGPSTDPGSAGLVEAALPAFESARMAAVCGAIAEVGRCEDLVPIGMVIGPFSLMVKLAEDPITAVFAAGKGAVAGDNPKIATVELVLELGARIIEWSIERQIAAGARAVVVCEPAASNAFISPRQLAAGSDIFERYVVAPNRRIKEVLSQRDVDLIFHCCGEITDGTLRSFCGLDPAILSLGSSRVLWEDASVVPETTVLFGNLPSKKFFNDAEITAEEVRELAANLRLKMRETGHPFILGTECDVLSVEGCEQAIWRKLHAMEGGCP